MQAPSRLPWTQYASPVLLIGPAYAGKSELAMQALRPDIGAVVIGSAPPDEPAFASRLNHLQSLRPACWESLHAGMNLVQATAEAAKATPGGQILIDAVNQWLAVMLLGNSDAAPSAATQAAWLDDQVSELLRVLRAYPTTRFVLVSAEVGASPAPARVPERLYRQYVGVTNQRLAAIAQTVVSVQVGLGTVIKG